MQKNDLTRLTLAIIIILLLIVTSLWVLKPFLASAAWATMLVVATWPLMKSLQTRFGGKRAPAVAVMLFVMLLLMLTPMWLITRTVIDHAGEVSAVGQKLAASGIPGPPGWVAKLPIVGHKVSVEWMEISRGGAEALMSAVSPYASSAAGWVLGQLGSLGGMVVHLLLVVLLSGVMYVQGEHALQLVTRFSRRLSGERGVGIVILSGQAIRGVAMGVGLTALVQTVLGGIGLAISGVPFASLLTIVMLVFCIAQLGPGFVLFPAVGWLYWTGDTGLATFLLVWSLVVVGLDNFLRPYLIKKGADLPLLLIFSGVIGGLLGFGLIGIFIGPLVLAITSTLLDAWIEDSLGKAEEISDAP